MLVGPLAAQDLPKAVWAGEVDDVVTLYFRGDVVEAERARGLPLQRQRYRFYEPLPEGRTFVQVDVIEARGRVRVIEQPRPSNQFTLQVRVEDPQPGAAWYVLALRWGGETGGGFLGRPEAALGQDVETLRWEGRVDGEVVVRCAADGCEPEVIRGAPVVRDRFWFSSPLPAMAVTVNLEEARGRGEIRLIEQPRPDNGYRVSVWIRDVASGAGDYSFVLSWKPLRAGMPVLTTPGAVWRGRVDGRVRVIVQGDQAQVEVVSGQPVEGAQFTCWRPLPQQHLPQLTVRRRRGRGRVEIVEYPSARNDYRLVFEIDDRPGGAADYEVEVAW